MSWSGVDRETPDECRGSSCTRARGQFPGGERPPALCAYPQPPASLDILFIGWNPPIPLGGFWSLKAHDKLRIDLHWVLRDLRRITAIHPDAAFLREFSECGDYFLHAVKCWSGSTYPGFGRDKANRMRRLQLGEPLLHACAEEHLFPELDRLTPTAVCALGELAFLPFQRRGSLDQRARPTEGRQFMRGQQGLPWDVLYSCLCVGQRLRQGSGQRPARAFVRDHLTAFRATAPVAQ